jgi:hypothetical protein
MSFSFDNFNLMAISDNPLSTRLYESLFDKINIVMTPEAISGELINKVPIVIDIFFKEYCPICGELMPPGTPPLECYCGEIIRLGYIPLYNLPRIKFGYAIVANEFPKKSIKALRSKGWKALRIPEDTQTERLKPAIMELITGVSV